MEKKFDELGGTLDEAATAEAAKTADTQWENNSDLYAANGISKATLEKYQLNSKKADACLKLIYGENGSSPVTEQEYADYITTIATTWSWSSCRYLTRALIPLPATTRKPRLKPWPTSAVMTWPRLPTNLPCTVLQ